MTKGNPNTSTVIGDKNAQFLVLGNQALANRVANQSILREGTPEGNAMLETLKRTSVKGNFADRVSTTDAGLILGYPIGLLGERQVFGAVITNVSDNKSEDLGRLRLSDIIPMHVRPVVGKSEDGKYLFALMGCARDCVEGSKENPLLTVPVTGVDQEKGLILIDLGVLGNDLNIVKMKDPSGMMTKLKTKTSEVVAFDYSYSTLVFDIKTTMVPMEKEPEDVDVETEEEPAAAAPAGETVFMGRWYLRLSSAFDPAFEVRDQTPGVGFFTTRRSKAVHITRFAKPADEGGVKYYIKNVPKEHRPAFAASFDGWNAQFKTITGKNLLSYEFLEETDPRYKLVVAGDIRFNVLEWDLQNLAPYGGFGPSIANQHTGQTLSANVLIQGPKIIEGYSKWFKASKEADSLDAQGRVMEAEQLRRQAINEINARESRLAKSQFKVTLGSDLEFTIHSQAQQLEDPAFASTNFFDPVPKGFTFETYMPGYFKDMVEHELGHNLGLRHNFRGNLSGKQNPGVGEVSHSVMEYLGRSARHLDQIGPYDTMAIKYGYTGVAPDKLNLFCTDEDVPDVMEPTGSAECSRDDATNDPFAWFESRVARSLSLVVGVGSTDTPTWALADVEKDLSASLLGMGFYATSAEDTGETWTNFFTGGDRPKKVDQVRAYVAKKIQDELCNPDLQKAVDGKSSATAKEAAALNLKTIREKAASILGPLNAFDDAELACN